MAMVSRMKIERLRRGFTLENLEKQIQNPVASLISIYVSDDFLDLSRPIKVELNGSVVFEKPVKRSAEFLLEHMEKTGDRGRVFSNRIKLH